MLVFYKIWKKLNEIQLTKNKMDLNIWKMMNGEYPWVGNTLPRYTHRNALYTQGGDV